MSTSVPPIQWLPTGPQAPQESAILQGRQTDINNAFGGNLNPALNTPQGQLASSDAAIIADKNAAIVYVASQMDPDTAADAFQDAIGRIYFMERVGGTASTVSVTNSWIELEEDPIVQGPGSDVTDPKCLAIKKIKVTMLMAYKLTS